MTDQHPWDTLKTDIPQPGSVKEEADDYSDLPDAATASNLPDNDADNDEDIS